MPAPGTLVLLRHGQSVLNAQDRFTGLLDPPLTPLGEDEAARAAALLVHSSFSPGTVYTSTLTRTRATARIVLAILDAPNVPVLAAWKLNERSYGSLTGRARGELLSELGPEVFRFWRRSYYGAPPPMSRAELGAIRRSKAFTGLAPEAVLPTESLCGVVKRVRIFWHQHLRPRIRAGEDVLVIGHGNSLRALCLVLDGLSHAEVEALNIPTGHPLAYRFTPNFAPLERGGEYLNPLAARTAAALVAAAGGT
ncbi:2,3-bisphosphoglycerate-dependent phosphoglycerate mutase [Arthrobacter sp. ISL-48]|uniref:2,3-bisphosphoglycerate-dependent phosphoglycerate mutase n=1 Tax=Arthrobacter sp. ISL-48 TaxID=2819110 RepID=UPI001BEBADF0|nr:2,3-bisphosphoglycerate-dependent phosphoglycerate mutase [Arthrobacter sp. ISL-48]MBT2531362.1 2,3-bisphosphoglycerate-dependent phosphoglycerate mutase [Arthrobacter sp. ISL-48]